MNDNFECLRSYRKFIVNHNVMGNMAEINKIGVDLITMCPLIIKSDLNSLKIKVI